VNAPHRFPLPNASTDLSDQVALVTGATAGLGRRFAAVLAAAGAAVVVAGRRLERLQQVADEIAGRGHRCAPAAMDVSRSAGLSDAVDRAEQAFGTITILVNNAGIPDAQRVHRMSLELIDAVIDTNLRGPFVLTCEVARRLIAAKLPGRIINFSSMGADQYQGDGAALYSVTKAAVNRMNRSPGRRVGPLRHQRQRNRARRVHDRDDGGPDRARRRLHRRPAPHAHR
jgi:NAD(P)-dependent dehydrogenase (short-subunit alcohol dehydrogenase family)